MTVNISVSDTEKNNVVSINGDKDAPSEHTVDLWLKQNEIQHLRNALLNQLQQAGWSGKLIDRYNQYLKNVSIKNRRALHGRTAGTDSQRGKTYQAEKEFLSKVDKSDDMEIRRFVNLEEVQIRTMEIVNSKTWNMMFNGSDAARENIHIEMKAASLQSGTGVPTHHDAVTYQKGIIRLSYDSLNELALLRELAHVAGNYHHDVSYRMTLVKLTSTFMGVKYAKLLKKTYQEFGLKMTSPKVIEAKSPVEWIEYYERMETARSARSNQD